MPSVTLRIAMRTPCTQLSALVRRRMTGVGAAAGARFLAAAVVLVDRGPGAPLGFFFRHAARLVAFGDVVGLAFLLVGVLWLVATRHYQVPRFRGITAERP
jgi:hypothetical protein